MNQFISQIQRLYPRIYMAAHVEHIKRRSSIEQISARDASILAHLTEAYFQSPKNLAKHMNIAASTMSEALHHLVSLGYATFETNQNDARHTRFTCTKKGKTAISDNSVLDTQKLEKLLAKMSEGNQQKVVDGLRLLADAAIGSEK